MSSIIDDIKNQFNYGSIVNRIIIINIAIYLFVILLYIGFRIAFGENYQAVFGNFMNWFSIPNNIITFIKQPWSLFTHMWLHNPSSFFHLLFNMIFLYVFGEIFLLFLKPKQLLSVYFLGGLAGVVFYMAFSYILPFVGLDGFAIGASACIMSLILATATLNPDYEIRLIFLGNVKIKWIALFVVFMDLFTLTGQVNLGGSLAHLGGALFGWYYMHRLKNGIDLGKPFYNIYENWRFPNSSKRKLKIVYKNEEKINELNSSGNLVAKQNKNKETSNQAKVDEILDKISEKGYKSLSSEEIDFLNKQ